MNRNIFYVLGDPNLPFVTKPHVNVFGRAIATKWGNQHRHADAGQGTEAVRGYRNRLKPESKHD